MRVPLRWLADYVPLPADPADLLDRLTRAGLEAAGVQGRPGLLLILRLPGSACGGGGLFGQVSAARAKWISAFAGMTEPR